MNICVVLQFCFQFPYTIVFVHATVGLKLQGKGLSNTKLVKHINFVRGGGGIFERTGSIAELVYIFVIKVKDKCFD